MPLYKNPRGCTIITTSGPFGSVVERIFNKHEGKGASDHD
jgi:hypothetical protein